VVIGDDDIDALVERAHADVQRKWPDIELALADFAAFVRERLPAGVTPAASLAALHIDQLFLACACVHGDPSALRHFHQAVLPSVDSALSRMRLDPFDRDDVRQLVLEKLFVPHDGPPRIETFTGRGELAGWSRAIAVRTALNYLRDHHRAHHVGDAELWEELPGVADDPELAHIRDHYRGRFTDVFRAAVAALSDRERTLLRYHYVDGLALHQIAAIYRVHRSTAFRWLDDARAAIVRHTRDALRVEIAISSSGIASIVRLIESQLEVVVAHTLALE
jgi:RNA polymerase sigma-70 factor, ECF subfamily